VIRAQYTFRQNVIMTIGIVSVIFSVGLVVLCIVSFWSTDTFSFEYDARTSYFISSHVGRIELARQYAPPTTNMSVGNIAFTRPTDVTQLGRIWGSPSGLPAQKVNPANTVLFYFDPHQLQHGRLDFGWTSAHVLRMVAIPDWFPLIFLVAASFVCWRISRVPFKRQTKHLCHGCGYDLRATPDRCPECGTVVPGRSESFLKLIGPHIYNVKDREP